MNRSPAKRSSLFLMEFLIALFFFLLVCAVCIKIFTKAHTISLEAKELNIAVQQTASYAEQLRAGVDLPEKDHIYYDRNWNPCSESNAYYCLSTDIISNGQEQSAFLELIRCADNTEIYSLSFNMYRTGEEMFQ